MKPPKLELFHATNDAASATVRSAIVARDLLARFRFRNVVYPEVAADLAARGGGAAPAIWDGQRLIAGADAVLRFLDTL